MIFERGYEGFGDAVVEIVDRPPAAGPRGTPFVLRGARPSEAGEVTQAELLVIKEPRLGMVPHTRQRVRITSVLPRTQQRFKIRSVSTC